MRRNTRTAARRKLRRINDEVIGGVCAGIAYWIGVPAWVVRMGWLCSMLYYGVGLGPYIILWICMPRWEQDPRDYQKVAG